MSNKPQITATIKFRGVTIEGMTVEELRELRDALNLLVGERVIERKEYVPYYPYTYPHWTIVGTGGTCSTNTVSLGNTATAHDTYTQYTLTCN